MTSLMCWSHLCVHWMPPQMSRNEVLTGLETFIYIVKSIEIIYMAVWLLFVIGVKETLHLAPPFPDQQQHSYAWGYRRPWISILSSRRVYSRYITSCQSHTTCHTHTHTHSQSLIRLCVFIRINLSQCNAFRRSVLAGRWFYLQIQNTEKWNIIQSTAFFFVCWECVFDFVCV